MKINRITAAACIVLGSLVALGSLWVVDDLKAIRYILVALLCFGIGYATTRNL